MPTLDELNDPDSIVFRNGSWRHPLDQDLDPHPIQRNIRKRKRKNLKIDKNTFGGSKAAEDLINIINEMKDQKEAQRLILRISKIYHQYTKGMKELRKDLKNEHWKESFINLWFQHNKASLAKNQHIPNHIKSYVANLEKTLYRRVKNGDFNPME